MIDPAPPLPWQVFPEDLRGSMRWRMGPGQDIRGDFWIWFSRLTNEQAAQFAAENPEPPGWEGDYDLIRASPWTGEED